MRVNSVPQIHKAQQRRTCENRKRFTKQQAEVVAMKMNQKHHKQVYVEPCSKCNGWHVS